MARRRRVALCSNGLCTGDVRRGGRKWCVKCYAAMKRPKAECSVCGLRMAADLIGVGKRCAPCSSDLAHGKRVFDTYGITPVQYRRLLAHQGGKCAICWRRPATKRLAIDHDHSCCAGPFSCGKCVRGLLCRNCNRNVLGHLKEDRAALQRAIAYITYPPALRLFQREIRPDVTS